MKLITQNGQLELPKDFSLNMERTNPLLSGEGDASIPATLPSSSRNLAALGHRERIDRADRYTNKVEAILQVGPVQKRGQLVIDTMHRREGIDASFAIDNSDLYVKAKEKSLKAIFAEGDNGNDYKETFGNISTAMTRMQDIYAAGTDTYDYTIFPVSIAPYEENNIKHYQYNNEVDGGGNLVYEARTVREGDVNMSVPAGYGIAPFLKLHRMLVRLFECLGYTVSNNCFAEPVYQNIIIVHNCTDCLCNPTVTLCYKDMVPSCTLSEFSDWMLAKFHAQPVVNSETKEVKIVLMESVLADRVDIDITTKVEGDFTVQLNPTKRIVLTPTNSLEGTEPAADSFEELVEKYGGYVEADEDQWDSLTSNDPAYNDCLVLRMATGEFAALNYNIQTGLQAVEVIGTNHFTYDRHNSDDTEAFSQTDVMPLMRIDPATKRGVSPFVGERLHYHTSYKGQKEDDKQEIVVVQRAYNVRFSFKTTGTTQKFIPYGTYGFGNGDTLEFGLTNFELYEPFWGFYNTLLLNHATHLKCRVAYDLGQFLGLDMSRPKLCNGQKLLPVSASASLASRFGLTDAEFLLVKKFGDGVKDEGIEPMGGNGLKWSVSNDAEDVARALFAAYKSEIEYDYAHNVQGATATYTGYSYSLGSANINPGMPNTLGETRTVTVLCSVIVEFSVVVEDQQGHEQPAVSGSRTYDGTVTFTFTAVAA